MKETVILQYGVGSKFLIGLFEFTPSSNQFSYLYQGNKLTSTMANKTLCHRDFRTNFLLTLVY
jgi:hypothetical protein